MAGAPMKITVIAKAVPPSTFIKVRSLISMYPMEFLRKTAPNKMCAG